MAVEGYTLIRSDRPSRRGGGCALYLNSALTPSDEISWSDQSSNMVAVYIADVHVVMACVYRPPTAPLEPLLERLQVFIDTYSEGVTVPDIYVLGDFNLPDTDWNSYTSKDVQGATLLEFAARYFFTQTVNEPTRGENILDLVLTTREDYIIETEAEDWGMSDHSTVHCTLSFGVSCRVPNGYRES